MKTLSTEISKKEIVDSYLKFLQRSYPNLYKKYHRLRRNNEEAAIAEAVVFSWLWSLGLNPEISDTGIGGIDFFCHPLEHPKFFVEVTSLDSASVTEKSRIPDWPEIGNKGGGCFHPITWKLFEEAVNKTAQMSKPNNQHPRLLAITSSHHASYTLLTRLGPNLLVGDTMLGVPIGAPESLVDETTKLQNSVFFRIESGKIAPCRQSISGILLIVIHYNYIYVAGILHPEPAVSFENRCLPKVPFLQVTNWPVIKGEIQTAWAGPQTNPERFSHVCVTI